MGDKGYGDSLVSGLLSSLTVALVRPPPQMRTLRCSASHVPEVVHQWLSSCSFPYRPILIFPSSSAPRKHFFCFLLITYWSLITRYRRERSR